MFTARLRPRPLAPDSGDLLQPPPPPLNLIQPFQRQRASASPSPPPWPAHTRRHLPGLLLFAPGMIVHFPSPPLFFLFFLLPLWLKLLTIKHWRHCSPLHGCVCVWVGRDFKRTEADCLLDEMLHRPLPAPSCLPARRSAPTWRPLPADGPRLTDGQRAGGEGQRGPQHAGMLEDRGLGGWLGLGGTRVGVGIGRTAGWELGGPPGTRPLAGMRY